jgi:hypothetical protein
MIGKPKKKKKKKNLKINRQMESCFINFKRVWKEGFIIAERFREKGISNYNSNNLLPLAAGLY